MANGVHTQTAEALRKAHQAEIDRNPVVLTLTREELVPDRGGSVRTQVTRGPYRVRVFIRGGATSLATTRAGTIESNRTWGMLAPAHADLKSGPDFNDEFTLAPYGRFRIQDITPNIYGGILWGYQVDLERLD